MGLKLDLYFAAQLLRQLLFDENVFSNEKGIATFFLSVPQLES